MAKVNEQFKKFLSNIEPDSKAVKRAKTAHEDVRACLAEDPKFGQHVTGSFLYGSYRRHTAVSEIKDVDIVVLTNFDPFDDENSPHAVLRKLKAALARCYDDPENPQYQRRSIRVDDPLPDDPNATLTLDIIPAVALDGEDEVLLVPDRETKCWVKSHPKAHIAKTTELNSNDVGKGEFVPLVKMMKWWWKYQYSVRQPTEERPKPKGFWLEILTGEHFDPNQSTWCDHFIAILESITNAFEDSIDVPELPDPGLAGETIKTSMTSEEFQEFYGVAAECLLLAKQARDEEDEGKTCEVWRLIFGDKFPSVNSSKRALVVLGDTSHAQPLRYVERLQYSVSVSAMAFGRRKRPNKLISNRWILPRDLDIRFQASTNAPGPYEVLWQVVNTGGHAADEHGLRGEFFSARGRGGMRAEGPLINWESTAFTGAHWIEGFVIKDNVCVARSGRFYVQIISSR